MSGISEIEIPKHYVPTFQRNVQYALQNEGSLLRPYVNVGPQSGERASPVDEYGSTRGIEKVVRNADTPTLEVERDRRWVFPRTYHWATMVDTHDTLKQVLDPTSRLAQACVWGLGENIDYDIILPNFFDANYKGKEGTTPVNFDTTNMRVAVTIGSSGGATPVGMNVAKIQRARYLLRKQKVKLDRERPVLVMGADEENELFEDTKAINGDFISGRPIEKGMLPSLFNFDFVIIEDLPRTADPYVRCPFWVKSGVHLGDWQSVRVRIGERADKSHSVQVYAEFTAGFTRLQEGKCGEILCTP